MDDRDNLDDSTRPWVQATKSSTGSGSSDGEEQGRHAAAAAAEAVVAPTEDEANDPDAPKGPIGKLLKTVNDRAVDATKEDADRFAEASAAAAVNAEDAVDSQAAPMYRASEGESKRKKRTKPAQKGGKKKKKKAA